MLGSTAAPAGRTATAVATVTNGLVSGITVLDGGAGYTLAPAVSLTGGGGAGATALALVNTGEVSQIIVLTPGGGYTNAPLVVIDPPPPGVTPATLAISVVPGLVVSGQPQTPMEIQYADALGDTNAWFTLTNLVLGDAPSFVVDVTVPAGSNRIYRAVALSAPGPDPAQWVWVPPGTFTMGSPATEYDRSVDEGPQTVVTFTHGYWIGRYEVTEGEYSSLIGTNPAVFTTGTNQPVEHVSWYDAYTYCARLTLQERAAGRVPAGYEYRLPTEAEWECATRAGTTTRFSFGDDPGYTLLPNYAWFIPNSDQTTHQVGTKLPNPWGIYDMSGNVFEWCADWYGPYPGGSVTDPTGAASGANRVMRGGNWRFPGGDARSAARNFNPPDFAGPGIGFRAVLGPVLP
ncbi:MAG: formylglycine-generating enzyme family protein [Verrucomicrobia bacterium]|nr:formylglycine-generating enzyme family protein [Verrucomicrobiota bacterium]